MVGVQPLRSHALLAAADGGLPQRFTWLPTADPDASPTNARPTWPVGSCTARLARGNLRHLRPVGGDADRAVPACAVAAIDYRLAVLRNYRVDALDGHALLCRLKVAGAMMALDGRTTIEEADWHLAGHVMESSAVTRDQCLRSPHRAQPQSEHSTRPSRARRDHHVNCSLVEVHWGQTRKWEELYGPSRITFVRFGCRGQRSIEFRGRRLGVGIAT